MASKPKNTSIEEQIEDIVKKQLDSFAVKYYTKTKHLNDEIKNALNNAKSKSGNDGGNFPDVKCIIQFPKSLKTIPVLIEVKGTKGKLIKEKNGTIANYKDNGEPDYKDAISKYAVNGAVHYAEAVTRLTQSFPNAIAIGVNGYKTSDPEPKVEMGVYYVSKTNMYLPIKIDDYTDLSFLQDKNLSILEKKIDTLFISEAEKEKQTQELEYRIENILQKINQDMHDKMRISEPKDRVKIICALIMAALGVEGKISPLEIADLKGEQGANTHDGRIIIARIEDFLKEKNLPEEKLQNIISLYSSILNNSQYYKAENGISILKSLYTTVVEDIMPIFSAGDAMHIDFTGKLLNTLTSWIDVRAQDDSLNDVVLTPRYVTELMAKLCKVNKDSYVWDWATGSAGFLVAAMKLMIEDANTIKSEQERQKKILNIKLNQLLGVEIRDDIYVLAVLNMILMKDGSSHILNKNSLTEYDGKYEQGTNKDKNFPADVFLLNPPYSAEGNGLVFVDKALKKMNKGYACVIIQESAGNGKGNGYPQEILKHSTMLASIRMPSDLFIGKSSVQTSIYLFKVGEAHNEDNNVTFVDFSYDGYKRQARKKSNARVNLRDDGTVKARYEELVNIVLNRKTTTDYYTEANKLVVKEPISLNGDDWNFTSHKKIDKKLSEKDFRKTVADFLSWKISNIIHEAEENF